MNEEINGVGHTVACSEDTNWSAAARLAELTDPVIPETLFWASDYGVVTGSRQDMRGGLQAAIDACHRSGGGRVLVGAGDYLLCGPIELRSRVDLHLEEHCRLRFSGNPIDFLPPVYTRWEGIFCYNYSPFIRARKAEHIAITGRGVIDGAASRAFTQFPDLEVPAQPLMRDMAKEGKRVEERVFGDGFWLRPNFCQLVECQHVLIEGVTFEDSPLWVVHPVLCRHVIVRHVTVDSHNHYNDGCDPDSSEDVLIENCTFRTGDDAIAIKSGRDHDGWRVGRPTRNVLIRNCELSSRCNGLCIGSEMSGGVNNIFMEDCRVGNAASVIYCKANLDRGGVVERVFVRNITVERARCALVRFETNYHSHRGGNYPPVFRNFRIEQVSCGAAENYGVYIDGASEAPVSGVYLRDIELGSAREPLWLQNFRDLELDGVSVGGQLLPRHPEANALTVPKYTLTY